jgi:hypothetical protein
LQPVAMFLAQAAEEELVQTVEYLKEENWVRRGKFPKRLEVTPVPRARLIELGTRLGCRRGDVTTILDPRTCARGVSEDGFGVKRRKRGPCLTMESCHDSRGPQLREATPFVPY